VCRGGPTDDASGLPARLATLARATRLSEIGLPVLNAPRAAGSDADIGAWPRLAAPTLAGFWPAGSLFFHAHGRAAPERPASSRLPSPSPNCSNEESVIEN